MVWQKLLGLVSLVVTHRLKRILNDPYAIQNLRSAFRLERKTSLILFL